MTERFDTIAQCGERPSIPQRDAAFYLATLANDGVVKIPQVFTADEVSNLRRAIFETLIQTDDRRQYNEGGHIQWRIVETKRWPAIMFWPALINDDLRDFRKNSKFISIVRIFLSSDIRQMNNQVYLRLPGDGDEFNIHQDYVFRREIADTSVALSSYIQTIVAVDRMDASNGGIEFFIGSHKRGLLKLIADDRSNLRQYDPKHRQPLAEQYQARIFDLNPGDMLVWNLLVAHGSTANTSDRTRITYMNGFCDAMASESWPHYITNGNVVDLCAEQIPVRRMS